MGFLKFDTSILQFDFGSIEEKFYIYLMRKENKARFKADHILGQVELTIRTVSKDIGVSENIARRLIKQFQELNIIKLISKSNSKQTPSIYMLCIYQKHTVDNTVNNTVNNTVDNIVSTQLNVEKSTVLEDELHSCNTVNNTVKNTVDNTSKINNKINNKIDIFNIVVNSNQLELIKKKCLITGDITEEQQRQIKNMNIDLLEKTIEKCNNYRSSYNINYLLQAYRNGEQENKVTPITQRKTSMSEKLGIANLNRTQKYEDLEERLLKLQTTRRNI